MATSQWRLVWEGRGRGRGQKRCVRVLRSAQHPTESVWEGGPVAVQSPSSPSPVRVHGGGRIVTSAPRPCPWTWTCLLSAHLPAVAAAFSPTAPLRSCLRARCPSSIPCAYAPISCACPSAQSCSSRPLSAYGLRQFPFPGLGTLDGWSRLRWT